MSTSKEELQARLTSVEITEKAIEAKIHSLKNDFQKQLEALETSRQLFDAELQTLGKNAMNSLIKTTAALLLMTIALHVLSSCVSNNYTGFYSQHSNAEYIANETDMPIMMEDRDGQLLYQLLTKEDFIIILKIG